jgi:hypothetical protein
VAGICCWRDPKYEGLGWSQIRNLRSWSQNAAAPPQAKELVEEKELRLKEGMLMMGLHPTAYFLSWLVTAATELTGSAILATIVAKIMFRRSSFLLVFMLIELYCLAAISMCFLLSAVFSKARTASIFAVVALYVTVLPLPMLPADLSAFAKTLLSLLPGMAFGSHPPIRPALWSSDAGQV